MSGKVKARVALQRPSLATVLAVVVTLAGWALSFEAQVGVAMVSSHRFPWPQPILFGCTTELVSLSCMALARKRAREGRDAREVMTLMWIATAMILGANILIGWPDVIGILMHVWTCLIAVWLWKAVLFPDGIRGVPRSEQAFFDDSQNTPKTPDARLRAPSAKARPRLAEVDRDVLARQELAPQLHVLLKKNKARANLLKAVVAKSGLGLKRVQALAREVQRSQNLDTQNA